MIRLFKASIILFTLLFPSFILATSSQWIVGTWELFHDPDGDEKDWIEFTDAGEVVSFTQDKTRQVHGTYEVGQDAVRIVYELYGQSIPVVLTYKQNKSALFAFSSRTGNTSTYKKKR